MSSPPTITTATKKKSIRELNSIANNLLLHKTLNARNNQHSSPMTSIENTPNYLNTIQDNKGHDARLHPSMKSVDNIANLLQYYQTLSNQSASSPFTSLENSPVPTTTKR